jgi:murein DD-endopeptidase MepM/ murein hydrolase activator NlpD
VNREDYWLAAMAVLVMTAPNIEWGDPSSWAWPVPDVTLAGVVYPAQISNGFVVPSHYGVDVMYRRDGGFDPRALGFQGHDGNAHWFAPSDTPILAARAGTVWSVDRSRRGIEVVLDHGVPWATYYQHLTTASVQKGDHVQAGQRIGTMGFDPTDPEGLRHLHFAAWYRGVGNAASVDPEGAMAKWQRLPWVRGKDANV